MKWLKRVCILVLLAAAFFWGMLFTSENTAQVSLNLVFWKSDPASVSLWVILGFAAGGLLGLAFSLMLITKLRASLLRAERRAQLYEKEVINLRTGVVKAN